MSLEACAEDPQAEAETSHRYILAGKHRNHLVRVGCAEDGPDVGEDIVVIEAQTHVVQQCGLVQIPESDHVVRRLEVRFIHGHEDGVFSRMAVLLLKNLTPSGHDEEWAGGGRGRGGGVEAVEVVETDHASCSIFAERVFKLDGDFSAATFGDFCREPGLGLVVVPHP
eukprot:COSAG02_NODE_279_length_25809_cov_21.674173_2_plen_168_part_00